MTTPSTAHDVPDANDVYELVTVGETMVVFSGRAGSARYVASPAGAESNVAAGLALLGHSARWVSRLGDDHLGRFVADEIARRGVTVEVEWDDRRPTGVMTKLIQEGATERRYYRSDSAARMLSPADLLRLRPARRAHVTGITAAISPSAAELVRGVTGRALGDDVCVSFDVNLRAVLWPDLATASAELVPLARAADVVFIGDDESLALLDTDDVAAVAAELLRRDDQELVFKRGGAPATLVVRGRHVTVPALPVDVVDPTGAGDAFAAGYLAGRCRGWPDEACLRLGHLLAGRVLLVTDDVAPPFAPAELAALSPESLERRWSTA